MNLRIIIMFVLAALLVFGGGYFVWMTWPRSAPEPVVTEPTDTTPPPPTSATYASTTLGTIVYPSDYTMDEHYEYSFSATKGIGGVKFTIPAAMATGTNLSSDTYISVEQLPRAKKCTADIYMIQNVKAQAISDGGISYSFASSSDAGAGNFYQEYVYALPSSNPCTAVRYYIHSTNIGNYPAGAVTQFNQDALLAAFDTIRRSYTK